MQGEGSHHSRIPRPERRADGAGTGGHRDTGSAALPVTTVTFAGRQALQAAVSVPAGKQPSTFLSSHHLAGARTPADRREAGLEQDHGKRYHRQGICTECFLVIVSRRVVQKTMEKQGWFTGIVKMRKNLGIGDPAVFDADMRRNNRGRMTDEFH